MDPSTSSRPAPRGARVGVFAALVVGLLVAGTGFAVAQAGPGGPTGSTGPSPTTTAPPPPGRVCHIRITGVEYGPQVATVFDAPPNTPVNVLFNGEPIAQGRTDARGTASVRFRIPAGRSGSYAIVAAGVACDPFAEPGGAPVHRVSATGAVGAGGVGTAGEASGGGGGPELAFTGTTIALLGLLAVALAVIGRALTVATRGRRRNV